MPDFTIEYARTCASNESWETEVPSSRPGQPPYKVCLERLWGALEQAFMCQYGFTCTCPDFVKRSGPKGRHCKHIAAVEASGKHCGWNAELEPFAVANADDTCPDCGGETSVHRVAV
jgi:hypothetical protein